jgi:hypothetical protein
MWLGREVRFWTILLSCVAGFCGGACAHGTEGGSGSPTCQLSNSGLISLASLHSLHSVALLYALPSGSSIASSYPGVPNCSIVAMALPDGPGAVCLGVLGFMCVSLIKNRRIWIGLCLFVLGGGRLGAARLSRMGAAAPELGGPDSLSESGSDHVLWHQLSCRVPVRSMAWAGMKLCMSEVLGQGPRIRFLSGDRSPDDRDEKGLLSWADRVSDGFCGIWIPQVCWGALRRLVSDGCIELARPPPGQPPKKSG